MDRIILQEKCINQCLYTFIYIFIQSQLFCKHVLLENKFVHFFIEKIYEITKFIYGM